jgi:hypothetical protein
MGIFKKIKSLYKSISVDIEAKIDTVNQECKSKLSALQDGDAATINKRTDAYIERMKGLATVGRSIEIAPEVVPPFAKDEQSAKIDGDQLENRIRYHAAHLHSLFWTIIAAFIACASFFVSLIALLLTICKIF